MANIANVAELFAKKCIDNMNEVLVLVQKKIQDPGSIIQFQASGALVDAAMGNLGSLRSYGEQYVKNNAEALTIAALQATGLESKANDALNLLLSTFSSMVGSYNDIILLLTKNAAKTTMEHLDYKRERRAVLIEKMGAYLKTLELMREGPSVFAPYLKDLRDALNLIDEGHRNLKFVSNTYQASDLFLTKRFDSAKQKFEDAAKLLKPADNPYFDPALTKNQALITKTRINETPYSLQNLSNEGSVDTGNPNVFDGSFSSANVGDVVAISYTPEDRDIISPINDGRYKIVTKISSQRVLLSEAIDNFSGTGSNSVSSGANPNTTSIKYANGSIFDNSVNVNIIRVGDEIRYNSPSVFLAKVSGVDPKAKTISLDRPAPEKAFANNKELSIAINYTIERKKGTVDEIIIPFHSATLKRGAAIPDGKQKAKVYPVNQLSSMKGLIKDISYQVFRYDGLQVDRKTFIDKNVDFAAKNVTGHLLRILSPSNVAGAYKIINVEGKNTIKLGAEVPLKKDEIREPVFDIEYEVKVNFGVPTDKEQMANILAIPVMTNKLVLSSKAYFKHTLLANGGLVSFMSALDNLLTGLPSIMKKFVVDYFNEIDKKTNSLTGNMATVLNGSPTSIRTVARGHIPDTLKVSTFAFKWTIDLALIRGMIKMVPAEALTKLNVSTGPAKVYREVVEALKRIDTYRAGTAIVIGEDGQEELGQLETQLFTLLTSGNTLIITGSLREEIIALGRSILRNLELAQKRDDDVYAILDRWVKYPIDLESELQEMVNGLSTIASQLGLDKWADSFKKGNFQDTLAITSGRQATFVGAALVGLALLKECFSTPEDSASLDKIVYELEKEEQLLDLKLSIDFDLSILKKTLECLRFNGLAANLNIKEIFCGLAKAAVGSPKSAVGAKMDSVYNSVDSGVSGPDETAAADLTGVQKS